MSDIVWVPQTGARERNGGCGIATLAMLLDMEYNAVRDLAPDLCEKCGVEQDVMDAVLASRGYAVLRRYPYNLYDGTKEAKWPPKPFGPRHLVLVLQKRTDHVAHWIAADHKLRCFDPADDVHTPSRLSRYYRIESVAAVVPVKQ